MLIFFFSPLIVVFKSPVWYLCYIYVYVYCKHTRINVDYDVWKQKRNHHMSFFCHSLSLLATQPASFLFFCFFLVTFFQPFFFHFTGMWSREMRQRNEHFFMFWVLIKLCGFFGVFFRKFLSADFLRLTLHAPSSTFLLLYNIYR